MLIKGCRQRVGTNIPTNACCRLECLINNGNVTSRSCIYREMPTSASKIITPSKNASLGQVKSFSRVSVTYFLTSFLTSSHWFPLVGCGVPVGLNDGSTKPSLAYV